MYKKIVPLGSKMSFPQIVEDMQVFSMRDTRDKLQPFVQQYGVVTKSSNGVATGDELLPTYAHASGINLNTYGKVIFAENFYTVLAGGTNKLVYNLNTVGASAGYQIYINYDVIYSEPVDVTNGFKYPAASGYTKQTPSYYIAAKPIGESLTNNQIRLASGITNGSGELDASSFYDARTPFILDSSFLDENMTFLLDRANEYNYMLTLNSGLRVDGAVNIDTSAQVSGVLTVIGTFNQNYAGASAVIRDLYGFDSDGASLWASSITNSLGKVFRLNNGLKTGALQADSGSTLPVYDSAGTYLGDVITTGETPTTPQNLRLFDINGDKYSRSDSIASLKWNYDDVILSGVATGVSGLYTNPEQAFKYDNNYVDASMTRYETITADSLVGKKLYFPNTGNSYTIVSNGAASIASGLATYILISTGLSFSDAQTTQVSYTTQTPSRIIDDADGYLLTIERKPKNLSEANDFALNITQYKDTFVLPQEYVLDPKFTAHLPTDAKYEVKIQAQKKFAYSSQIRLNEDYAKSSIGFSSDQAFDGTDTVTIAFQSPTGTGRYQFYNSIPFSLEGTLNVRGTSNGFNLAIGGYYDSVNPTNNPQDYEIVYTAGTKPTDWDLVNVNDATGQYTRIVTESKNISVSTVERKQWHIAVWPRINGMRVGGPLTASVTGGAGGVYPDNSVIADTKFSLKSYIVSGISNNVIDAQQAISPAMSGVGVYTYGLDPQDVLGQVIQEYSSGNEFRITDAQWFDSNRTSISLDVSAIDGSGATTVSGLCYINTTKKGRRIYKSLELPIDYQLVSASVSIDAGKGVSTSTPGIIRIYQDGLDVENSGAVDYIEVETIPSDITSSLDETIQGNRSGSTVNRTLIIDAYDPDTTSPNNYCNLTGEIIVNAGPLIIGREGDRPIPNISL